MIQRRSALKGMMAAPFMLAPDLVRAAEKDRARLAISDIELTHVRVNRRGNWLLPRLKTASGLTGLGDASHSPNDAQCIAFLKQYLELMRGRSVFDIEWFRRAAEESGAGEGGHEPRPIDGLGGGRRGPAVDRRGGERRRNN